MRKYALNLSKWHEENFQLMKSYYLDRFEQVERSKKLGGCNNMRNTVAAAMALK